jgi:16S rRNA G966 N2-methylase RsmD
MQPNDSIFRLGNAHLHSYALYLAHELQLFEIIAEGKAVNIGVLCERLNVQKRPMQALLSLCAANGFLIIDDNNNYAVSDTIRNYLLRSSPFPWGFMLDIQLLNHDAMSYQSMKQSVLSNSAPIYADKDLFESNESCPKLAAAFTRAMHGKSKASSNCWPLHVDLKNNRCLLDIAGGSGIHAISAVNAFPNLTALVLDRPEVCKIALGYIYEAGQKNRVDIVVKDMWHEDFPKADVHFYCDVFHDWPYERCCLLAKKSYDSLPSGGKILVHELLLNDDKMGPVSAALYNMVMIMWTKGQQFSTLEITDLLKGAGFNAIRVTKTGYGDWSLIEGVKP